MFVFVCVFFFSTPFVFAANPDGDCKVKIERNYERKVEVEAKEGEEGAAAAAPAEEKAAGGDEEEEEGKEAKHGELVDEEHRVKGYLFGKQLVRLFASFVFSRMMCVFCCCCFFCRFSWMRAMRPH